MIHFSNIECLRHVKLAKIARCEEFVLLILPKILLKLKRCSKQKSAGAPLIELFPGSKLFWTLEGFDRKVFQFQFVIALYIASTLLGNNISRLWTRNIIFPATFEGL